MADNEFEDLCKEIRRLDNENKNLKTLAAYHLAHTFDGSASEYYHDILEARLPRDILRHRMVGWRAFLNAELEQFEERYQKFLEKLMAAKEKP